MQFELRRIGTYTTPFYSMQAILYPNGNIVYQYNTLGATTNSATVGIQNGTNDDALMVAYNADYLHDGLAILFKAQPAWLTLSAENGTVESLGIGTVDITMDAANLPVGDHVGALTLTSNDPANPSIDLNVLFHVGVMEAVDSAVSPDVLDESDGVTLITYHVELPPEIDLTTIDIHTVMLNGQVPAFTGRWFTDSDFNNNGIPDLTVKFNREAVEAMLPPGEMTDIVITGDIGDWMCFRATDAMSVIAPALTTPNGGEIYYIGSPVTVRWNNPENTVVDHADLYFSLDDGLTWEPMATGVRNPWYEWQVPLVASDAAKVGVFIYGNGGLLGSDLSDANFNVTTDASAVPEADVTVYALKSAFPNPCNPKTTISFDLPKGGMTRLALYDVRGRLVRELVRGEMPRGRHEVVWLGKDNRGRQMASGVYFYRIESGEFTATRSLTLLK